MPINLNAVLADLEKLLRQVLGPEIELHIVSDASLNTVAADPATFEQVIMNLATNARDAMPGGGRLTIETRNVAFGDGEKAGVAWIRPGHYAMLAVADTGSGIDEALLARVFDPFFTTKDRGKGTGLGLSTAYAIIKQAGGYIRVSSHRGSGSRFEVLLPAVVG